MPAESSPPQKASQSADAASVSKQRADFGYDVTEGAKGFAPILGGVGGFVITAVTVVFTVRPNGVESQPTLLSFTIGLLVLGLIGCLMGAFVLAAIGAQRGATPNLPAATLYAGASSAIGVVAIVAAFEVLAALYLPDATTLFAMITLGMEVGAVVLVSLVLGDAWAVSSPLAPGFRDDHWLGTQERAYGPANKAAAGTAIAAALGGVLYFVGVRLELGSTGVRVFIGVGITLTVLAALKGIVRTAHTPKNHSAGIGKSETVVVLGTLTAYMLLLMICLP